MMTTTAAHNSARQYMQHDNEDRMQVWHREQLQLPIPNPRLQLTVNIPAHNYRKKYQNMKVTLTAYPSPALWLPSPHMMEELQWTSFSVVRVSDWIVVWLSGGECSGVQHDKGSPRWTALKCTLFSLNPSPAKFRRISHAVAVAVTRLRSVGDTAPPPV